MGGGGGGGEGDQLSTFHAESKSAKIPMCLYSGWRGEVTNFQLLMPSPSLLKSHIPYTVGRGGVGGGVGGRGVSEHKIFSADILWEFGVN